ncbi:MAG: class I SAM-dependent methyltransferase [Chloroflexota bacterium]
MKHQDDLAEYNQERWNAIVKAGSVYTRPYLDMTVDAAQEWITANQTLAKANMVDFKDKDVLCLAGSGGQQTTIFGLLGANVTVLDLSDAQLKNDKVAADYHNLNTRIEQGDMRDLSRFKDNSFDLVFQPYSINFVPEASTVIADVSRLLRKNGVYNLEFGNPFWTMEESDWLEQGYPVKQPYITGKEFLYVNNTWEVEDANGNIQKVEGPKEFLHTYSEIINSFIQNGLMIFHFTEYPKGDNRAEPGSWDHLCSIVPPFITIGGRLL